MKGKRLDLRAARRAAKASRAAAKLATLIAERERDEERRAAQLTESLGHPPAAPVAPGAAPRSPQPSQPLRGQAVAPAARAAGRRAMLIINTKSGPNNDSILHVREIAGLLQQRGLDVDVRVKLRKKQARRDARRAARRYPIVIAAGGDGTVAAVAAGLVNTGAVLGIIPLGTYNNVATSLVPPQTT